MDLLQDTFVLAEVVASRGVNVLVTGQLFDVCDVGAVEKQVGTESMPQDVRSKLLGDLGLGFQANEEARDVLPLERAHGESGRDEQGRMGIQALVQVVFDPEATSG